MTLADGHPVPLPQGTIDTHVHVFTPDEHPYDPRRSYSPATAGTGDLLAAAAEQGVAFHVLVQPSVYGTDNSAMLHALHTLGPGRARAVGVVESAEQADQLVEESQHLLVGLRLNLRHDPRTGAVDLVHSLEHLVAIAEPRDLFVQVFCAPAQLGELPELAAGCRVPIILDHFGGIRAADAQDDAQLLRQADEIARLLADCPNVWVKLSAPYRVLTDGHSLQALGPVVDAYAQAAPDRLVWASDWPHTGGDKDRAGRPVEVTEPFRPVDDLAQDRWTIAALRPHHLVEDVMVHNPSRLLRLAARPEPRR